MQMFYQQKLKDQLDKFKDQQKNELQASEHQSYFQRLTSLKSSLVGCHEEIMNITAMNVQEEQFEQLRASIQRIDENIGENLQIYTQIKKLVEESQNKNQKQLSTFKKQINVQNLSIDEASSTIFQHIRRPVLKRKRETAKKIKKGIDNELDYFKFPDDQLSNHELSESASQIKKYKKNPQKSDFSKKKKCDRKKGRKTFIAVEKSSLNSNVLSKKDKTKKYKKIESLTQFQPQQNQKQRTLRPRFSKDIESDKNEKDDSDFVQPKPSKRKQSIVKQQKTQKSKQTKQSKLNPSSQNQLDQSKQEENNSSFQEAPPTKGKDLGYLLQQKEKKKRDKKYEQKQKNKLNNENQEESAQQQEQSSFAEPESHNLSVSEETSSFFNRGSFCSGGGKGKGVKGQWAKIIVKITHQRCILFNITEKNIDDAFSSIKAPDGIKSKASIILTSNENMFIMGGEEKGAYQGKNYQYNFVTLEFTERAPMPEFRVEFGCIFFGGNIYLVGGWKEQYVQRCDFYNIHSDTWYDLPPLNDEREDISLCIVADQYLYALGNVVQKGRRFRPSKINSQQGKGDFLDYTLERIDLSNIQYEKWETITVKTNFRGIDRMPTMKHMGSFNHYINRNEIILFGGGVGSSLSQKCYCIDLEKGTISKYARLSKPDRFQNHLFFKKEDKLFAFGEFFLHVFNLEKTKWVNDAIPLNLSVLN